MHIARGWVFVLLLFGASNTYAWFIIFPIPNLAKPPELQNLIDALEKSTETRAVAYVSEDKTFGRKYWTWGHYTGKVSQAEANNRALKACENSLALKKLETAGGQPLYDFGNKRCELYEFATNNAVPPAQPNYNATPSNWSLEPQSPVRTNAEQQPTPLKTATEQQEAQGNSPTVKRLRELKSLFDQGLITKEEYEEKRKAVLKDL